MSLFSTIDPKYYRQVVDDLLQNLNMLVSQLSRVWVDESARLAVRVGYMDDGYIRIRDAGETSYSMAQMTQELLRNLQYGFGVQERLLTLLIGALASVGTDKLRITPVDPFPQSPITIATDNVGLAKDATLSSFIASPGSGPPSKGVALLGYDGTYMRLVKTTSDGKVVGVLG